MDPVSREASLLRRSTGQMHPSCWETEVRAVDNRLAEGYIHVYIYVHAYIHRAAPPSPRPRFPTEVKHAFPPTS